MSTKEDLIAARALIDTPEKWVKGTWSNEDRSCFCIRGAVSEATGGYPRIEAAEDALEAQVPKRHRPKAEWASALVKFNDAKSTTHAHVMALFDRAIESQP